MNEKTDEPTLEVAHALTCNSCRTAGVNWTIAAAGLTADHTRMVIELRCPCGGGLVRYANECREDLGAEPGSVRVVNAFDSRPAESEAKASEPKVATEEIVERVARAMWDAHEHEPRAELPFYWKHLAKLALKALGYETEKADV